MITSRNLSSKTVGPDWQSSTALKKTSFQGSKDKNSIKIFLKKDNKVTLLRWESD